MKNRATPFLFVPLLFVVSIVYGQANFEKGYFIEKKDTLKYRILYPDNFDVKSEYPVILFLHGAGERGSDNKRQLFHGSKMFLDQKFRTKYPAIVIFPQCPKDDYWSNVEIDRSGRYNKFFFKEGGEPTRSMNLVLSLMDSVVAQGYSDDKRIYVGGLSMGGMGTFEILSRRPKMFNAAFPICGGGNTTAVSKYASNVRLWVFHGAKDNVVLPSYCTDMVIALKKEGADVKYTLYKEANHNSWDRAFAEPGLFSWLFSN